LPFPFGSKKPHEDERYTQLPSLTPGEMASARREKGATFGMSDRAREIEQRLGME